MALPRLLYTSWSCLVSVKTGRGDLVLAESPMFGVTDVTLVFGDEQCQVSQHSSAALAARVTQICKSAILATKSCGPSLICFFCIC